MENFVLGKNFGKIWLWLRTWLMFFSKQSHWHQNSRYNFVVSLFPREIKIKVVKIKHLQIKRYFWIALLYSLLVLCTEKHFCLRNYLEHCSRNLEYLCRRRWERRMGGVSSLILQKFCNSKSKFDYENTKNAYFLTILFLVYEWEF